MNAIQSHPTANLKILTSFQLLHAHLNSLLHTEILHSESVTFFIETNTSVLDAKDWYCRTVVLMLEFNISYHTVLWKRGFISPSCFLRGLLNPSSDVTLLPESSKTLAHKCHDFILVRGIHVL